MDKKTCKNRVCEREREREGPRECSTRTVETDEKDVMDNVCERTVDEQMIVVSGWVRKNGRG